MKKNYIILIVLALLVIVQGNVVKANTTADGEVAYWSFDEGSGLSAVDGSTNSNDLTLSQDSWASEGHDGSAFAVPYGTYASIEDGLLSTDFPCSSMGTPVEAMTVAAWVKLDENTGRQAIVVKEAENQRGFVFSVTDGSITFQVYNEAGEKYKVVSSNAYLETGEWYHVAATYEFISDWGSTVRLYLNGAEDYVDNGVPGPIKTCTANLVVGAYLYHDVGTYNDYTTATIDEVHVYNSVLTSNEINELFEGASSGGQTPFGGTAWDIPGTIEVEDFDEGGEGVAYHDEEETNFGGAYRTDVGVDINYNGTIGWFKDGEWMEYTVNVEAGTYDVSVWSGTEFDQGQALAIYLDEEIVTVIDIPVTGSWDPTEYVVSDIELPAVQGGILKFVNVNGDYDFDKVVFTKTGGGGTVTGPTIDTLVKLNFSYDGFDQDGWTNVLGSDGFPVIFDNGITMDYSGGYLTLGSAGETQSSIVPNNVSNSYNWLSNADDTPGQIMIVGLDPAEKYTFLIYASRDDNDGALTEDRTTTYTIVGTTITGSINPVGNTDQFVTLTDIEPASTGAVVLELTKLPGQYGYINGLIIGKETGSGVQELAVAASIYPNPVQDQLTLTNLSSGSLISVYSISGSKVLEAQNGTNSELKVSLSQCRSGVYLVRVASGQNIQSFKVVKK